MGIYEDVQKAHAVQKEITGSFFSGESTPDLVKRIETDIKKGKKAEIGEVRMYSGKPWVKVSSTGNPNKDWQPQKSVKGSAVEKPEEKKEEGNKIKITDELIKERIKAADTDQYGQVKAVNLTIGKLFPELDESEVKKYLESSAKYGLSKYSGKAGMFEAISNKPSASNAVEKLEGKKEEAKVSIPDSAKKVLDKIKELTGKGKTFHYHSSLGNGGYAIDNNAAAASTKLPTELNNGILDLIVSAEQDPSFKAKLDKVIKDWGFNSIDKVKYEKEIIGGISYRWYDLKLSKEDNKVEGKK